MKLLLVVLTFVATVAALACPQEKLASGLGGANRKANTTPAVSASQQDVNSAAKSAK